MAAPKAWEGGKLALDYRKNKPQTRRQRKRAHGNNGEGKRQKAKSIAATTARAEAAYQTLVRARYEAETAAGRVVGRRLYDGSWWAGEAIPPTNPTTRR